MGRIEKVHWFLRKDCNCKCDFCFGPRGEIDYRGENDLWLARKLTDGNVGEVVLTGGEPLLARNLVGVARTLSENGTKVSVHTNGILLNREKIEAMKGVVAEVAIPIDASNRAIQKELRGKEFAEKVQTRLPEIVGILTSCGIAVRFHTVFTEINKNEMEGIYKMIRQLPFLVWKIFEYNSDLGDGSDNLIFEGTSRKAQIDGTVASFYWTREKLKPKDKRIDFVNRDDRGEYVFLEPDGQVFFYKGHSRNERHILGNLIYENWEEIGAKWEKELAEPNDAEEFFGRRNDWPLWQRIYEGNVDMEEVDQIDGRHWPSIDRLTDMWVNG